MSDTVDGISPQAWSLAVAKDLVDGGGVDVHVRGDWAYYSVTGRMLVMDAVEMQADIDHTGVGKTEGTVSTYRIVCERSPD